MPHNESLFTSVVQPCSIVSVTMSASVVLTVLVFQDMIRGKIFMQIVALISLCDFLGNWPYTLGFYPSNGTSLCAIESFCNLFFFPVGWVLTAFLTKLFRDLAVKCKIIIPLAAVLCISFGVPLIFTLLILTTNTYGATDDEHAQPCFYGGNFMTGYIWHLVTYDGLLYLCLVLMLWSLAEIIWLEYTRKINFNSDMYTLLKRVLLLYPIAMLVCWLPHAVCVTLRTCTNDLNSEAIVDIFKISHGGCVALIFFTMSNEARQRWIGLLCPGTKSAPRSSLWDEATAESPSDTTRPTGGFLPDDTQLATILMRESAMADDLRSSKLPLHSTSTIGVGVGVTSTLHRALIPNPITTG